MSLFDTEFDIAFERALTKHPRLESQEGRARSFLQRFDEIKKSEYRLAKSRRRPFHELLREALNECFIQHDDRPMFSSLVGFLFGRRGGLVTKSIAPDKQPTVVKTPRIKVVCEPSGQFSFVL